MKIEQREWTESGGWVLKTNSIELKEPVLVLAFGGKGVLADSKRYDEIRGLYPTGDIVLCTTAGEILNEKISDNTISLTAICFESSTILAETIKINSPEKTYDAGIEILNSLRAKEELVYILLISDGHVVNGSKLIKAIEDVVSDDIVVTGGLAGDGPNFKSTLVGLNEVPSEGNIIAVGFYGEKLKVGHASKGGWDPFGPERTITKSKDNILYELDDQCALDLYKKYLGELATELPSSALLFPLGIKVPGSQIPVVRTVLDVDEKNQSMIFAGDMPRGATVRMMKSNFDRLIDAASGAVISSIDDFGSFNPELAIVISCAGRKFVLQERVDEEIERVREVLGEETKISGFYSYGEISPIVKSTKCELHNQTLTITTLKEEL